MTILKTNGIALRGLSLALAATIFSVATQAQETVVHTPWQMIRTDVVDVKPPFATTHGDPANYAYAKLPDPAAHWDLAPVNDKGQLHFEELSRLAQGQNFKKLDFTYFRTLVYVSDDTPSITEFRVTIAEVDDGARMYLYNDNHLGGVYNEADDAKLMGKNVSTDFAGDAVPGWNMITIAQFDDAWKHNRLLNGVEIKVNGVVATPIDLEDLESEGGGSGEDDWPADGRDSNEGGKGKNIADGSRERNVGDRDGGGSPPGGSGTGKPGSKGNTGGPNGSRTPVGKSAADRKNSGNNGNDGPDGLGANDKGEPGISGEPNMGSSGDPKSGGGGSTGNRIAGGAGKGGSGSGHKGNAPKFDPNNPTFFPKKFTMETFGVDGKGRRGPEHRYFIGWGGKPGIITQAQDGNNGAYIFEIEKDEVPGGVALKVVNYRGGEEGKSYYLPNLTEEKHVYKVIEPLWNNRILTEDVEYNFRSLNPVGDSGKYLRHSGYQLYNQAANQREVEEEKSRRIYQQDATWHFHPIQDISTEIAGSTTKSGGEYTLTTNESNQSGAVWTSNVIDFGRDFEIKAEIYLGDTDAEGADGMALVFQNEDNQMVGKGGELGYKGISPSYIIEFDTYQNRAEFNDPESDHVGVRSDGSPIHDNDFVEVENLEDGNYHPISFEWNAETKTFNFKLDGKMIFVDKKFPESKFQGMKAFFGFTAATGLYKNAHKVRAITFSN